MPIIKNDRYSNMIWRTVPRLVDIARSLTSYRMDTEILFWVCVHKLSWAYTELNMFL